MKKNITTIFAATAIAAVQFGTVAGLSKRHATAADSFWKAQDTLAEHVTNRRDVGRLTNEIYSATQQSADSGDAEHPTETATDSAAQQSVSSGNIERLNEQFRSLSGAVGSVNKNLKGVDKVIIEVGGEMQQLQSEIASLTEKHGTVNQQLGDRETQLQTLTKQHETLRSKHADLEKEHETLRQQLGDHKTRLQDATGRHDTLQLKHADLEKEHEALRRELENVTQQLGDHKTRLQDATGRHVKLEEERENLRRELENVTRQLGDHKTRLQDATDRHDTLQLKHADLEKEHETLRSRHAGLERDLTAQQDKFEKVTRNHSVQLRSQKQTYERQIQGLNQQHNNEKKADIERLTVHLNGTVDDILKTAEKISKSVPKDNAELKTEVGTLISDIEVLKASLMADSGGGADDGDSVES
ncbi:MAG: hypothetical protein LBC04_03825 [Holosporaceae bacterium]|jgi:chromosome segregation ATPase|nr:hypothetical protein [Holosporaceae bacterium]